MEDENARRMFGDEDGLIVYFEFYAQPHVPRPISPEQAHVLHRRLIDLLNSSGYGFDGTSRLTTWEKEKKEQS